MCDPSCFPLSLLNHFFPSNWQRNIRQKTYFPLRPCALQTPCFLLFRCLSAALTLSQVSEGWSPGLPSFSLSPTRLLCWGILVAAWMTHPATWPLSSLTSLSFLSWPFYPRLPVWSLPSSKTAIFQESQVQAFPAFVSVASLPSSLSPSCHLVSSSAGLKHPYLPWRFSLPNESIYAFPTIPFMLFQTPLQLFLLKAAI